MNTCDTLYAIAFSKSWDRFSVAVLDGPVNGPSVTGPVLAGEEFCAGGFNCEPLSAVYTGEDGNGVLRRDDT